MERKRFLLALLLGDALRNQPPLRLKVQDLTKTGLRYD